MSKQQDTGTKGLQRAFEKVMTMARGRWCRTRLGNAFFVVLCIGVVLFVINYYEGFLSPLSSEADEPDKAGGRTAWNTGSEVKSQKKVKGRKRPAWALQPPVEVQACKIRTLKLESSVKQPDVTPITCTGNRVMYVKDSFLQVNQTVLQNRKLKDCNYRAIDKDDPGDGYHFSDGHHRQDHFEIKINHDFFRIECLLDKTAIHRRKGRELLETNDNRVVLRHLLGEPEGQNNHQQPLHTRKRPRKLRNENYVDGVKREPIKNNRYQEKEKLDKKNEKSIPVTSSGGKKDKNRPLRDKMPKQKGKLQGKDMKKAMNINQGDKHHQLQPRTQKPNQNYQVNIKAQKRVHQPKKAQLHGDERQANNGDHKLVQHERVGDRKKQNVNNGMDRRKEERRKIRSTMTTTASTTTTQEEVESGHGADFDQFVAQIVPKKELMERMSENIPRETATKLNVLIYGLESMSYLSYQRKLPRSYKFLKNILGAITMGGYTVLGDTVTDNIVPLLTSKTLSELAKAGSETRKVKENSGYVDQYPLVWFDFEKHGYVTLFAENNPEQGMFNFHLNGFEHAPTDHYMRPFWLAVDDYEKQKLGKRTNCLGGQSKQKVILNYLTDFFDKYKNLPKFAFAFSGEHDNQPAEQSDEDLLDFLKSMRRNRNFNNTLLIVMSDHGARYNGNRHSIEGKLEERLPMMSFVLPPWFRKKYPNLMKNLQSNADRLTTPFDLYYTIWSVLDIELTKQKTHYHHRGISLFKEIPLNRTCVSAGVDPHWCTCQQYKDADEEKPEVQRAARLIVEYINELTEDNREKCSLLKLKAIVDAKMITPNDEVLKFFNSKGEDERIANLSGKIRVDAIYYQVTIVTKPGDAMFEATVQYGLHRQDLKVLPTISRVNMYGNQPYCIREAFPDLRKFCYCKDFKKFEKRQTSKQKRT